MKSPVPGSPSILLVDDKAANLKLLVGLLKDHGYTIRPVTSGSQALDAAKASYPDLVLLDINMPEMDGYDVCAHFKADPALCDIPILFISASDSPIDRVKAFKVGGVDYVSKPFQLEELESRVRTHIELSRKRKELELNCQRLAALERHRDNLTNMIVHDMRTPISSLRLGVEMLNEYLPPNVEDVADTMRSVKLSLSMLSDMVNQMLDICQLEAGQLELQLEPMEAGALVRGVIGSIASHYAPRTIHLLPSEPASVVCDVQLARRVLANLLDNAIKYSPENTEVSIRLVLEPKKVCYQVVDQGAAIPSGYHSRLFEKFFQLDSDQRRSGAGLGLAFCKMAVEAQGGEIGVLSEVGKGNTFWFTLPRDS